jgi:hypothetical protein
VNADVIIRIVLDPNEGGEYEVTYEGGRTEVTEKGKDK